MKGLPWGTPFFVATPLSILHKKSLLNANFRVQKAFFIKFQRILFKRCRNQFLLLFAMNL
jgi:hypothetical protein